MVITFRFLNDDRHNFRRLDTIDQVKLIARRLTWRKLQYKDLIG